MNDQNHQISQEQKKKLKDIRGLSSRDEILGIPHRLCISIFLLSVFWGGIVTRHPAAVIVWLIVLGVPMHHIHKDDPQGFQVWCRAIFRKPKRWSAAKIGSRKLHLITKEE